MNKEREALKLALEALENGMKFVWTDPEREAGFVAIDAINEALAQPEQEGDWEKLYRLEVKKSWGVMKYERDTGKKLTRIVPMAEQYSDIISDGGLDPRNKFDAQPEQEPWCMKMNGCKTKCEDCPVEVQPAQQEPEFFTHCVDQPYDWSEWVCPDPKSYLFKCCDCGLVHEAEFGVVRYKSETEREECDMVNDANLQAVFRMRRSEQWSPVDTAHRAGGLTMEQPAQRTWVGLTDEEKADLFEGTAPYYNETDYADAIEAKLKEKNT